MGKFLGINFDPDFPFKPASNVYFQYTADCLNVIFQLIGNFFQAGEAAGAGKREDDNRHLGEIDFKNGGIVFKVTR